MGGRNSKATFNRQAEARKSQKKTYQKFRQSVTKLTKEVDKVKIQNKERLLELEISIKSAINDLEIAQTYTDPEFEDLYVDFLKNYEELDRTVKNKLEENDRQFEEMQQNERPKSPQQSERIETQENIINNTPLDIENAIFAEDISHPDSKEDKKKNKKSKKDSKSGELEGTAKKSKRDKNKDSLKAQSSINEEINNENVVEDSIPYKKDKKGKKNKNNLEVSFLINEEDTNQRQVAGDAESSKKDKKKGKKNKKKNAVPDNSLTEENEYVLEETPSSKDDNNKENSLVNEENTIINQQVAETPSSKEDHNKGNSPVNEENITKQVEDTAASKKGKKTDKKNKDPKQVDDNISRETLDELGNPKISFKKRFWSFPIRIKRKLSGAASIPDSPDPIIIIQDPENEDRSLQNIEINQLEIAIKNNNKKDKTNRRSKSQSQFFDLQQTGEASNIPPTPTSTPILAAKENRHIPEPLIQEQDSLQQIHNIRMSISTLEEMTNIYRLTKRGNYDYIYDNLCLCVNKLKDMEPDNNVGMLTLRHEKKLAMHQAQECLGVLEGKLPLPDQFDKRRSSQEDQRVSGGFPQVVIARTPSKRREKSLEKSVEFIDITNNDEIIDFALENNKELEEKDSSMVRDLEKMENISQDSTEFSEDDDLKDILMNLQDSTEEISRERVDSNKPVLITSF